MEPVASDGDGSGGLPASGLAAPTFGASAAPTADAPTGAQRASAQRAARPFAVPKDHFLQAIGYQVFAPEVLAFHRSTARIRIPAAPARTSKSYAGAYDALYLSMPRFTKDARGRWRPMAPARGRTEITGWIVAPSYQLAKEFDYLWREIVSRSCFSGFNGKIIGKANSPNQGDMRIRVAWGRDTAGDEITTTIDVKSATNPESCQAEEVDWCLMSEAAEQDKKIWYRYLEPRVHRLIAPTTPKLSADWLHTMIRLGEADPGLGIEAFQFTPHSNPAYDWGRFWEAHALAEARVLGRARTPRDGHDCFAGGVCKAMEDPMFAEQFGGRWTFDGDRVLPFRWAGPTSNVLDEVPLWVPHGKWYVSIDYGYLDPAVALFWSIGTDNQMVIAAEIYESKLDPEDFVKRILAKKRELNIVLSGVYSDPQSPSTESFLRKFGLAVFNVNKKAQRDRKNGFLRLVNVLTPQPATGQPKLHVLGELVSSPYGCPKTIAEWKGLRKRTNIRTDPWSHGAWIGDDHALDACRYLLAVEPTARTERWDVNDTFEADRRLIRQRNAMLRMGSGLRGVA